VGYLIDPPERVEGRYVAVFRQTDVADALAVEFLRDNGIDARTFPVVGDIAFEAFGGLGGGVSMFGGNALVCVPEPNADEALDLLEFDSGLVDFDDEEAGDDADDEDAGD
jgi:hypothetical protein